uniref:Olfactory receptor n=1 Tax=Geotrypetes seraphini TaxID=260995 RepID=A0A6P8NWF8_GEOSA|nr:olfactory receptor 5F1-like [Geotrypetes seraphini]XP_033780763.1 olfactory receptor 5F1-like [Geotrypetes seraphini]
MERENITTVREFIIVGFTGTLKTRIILFITFLFIYIVICMGNVIIITVIRSDIRLHTPMYLFISNLSFVEFWYTTSTIPKILADLLSERGTISFIGCIVQLYFVLSLGGVETFLLTAMSYDRYVAICNPLRYAILMSKGVCLQLIIGCWFSGFICILTPTILISRLPFCSSNIINHFFCDVSPLVQLSCSDTRQLQKFNMITAIVMVVGTFFLIAVSYGHIVSTILKINSSVGRKKAFSTCASHLMVVILYYGTVIFMYVRPQAESSLDVDKVTAVFYCVVTPMLNPIIYSLRNKEVKNALKKLITRTKITMGHPSQIVH